jgi:hypothetical protein
MKNCSHGLLLRLLLGAALAAAAAASVMVLDSRGNVEMVDSEYDARYDSLRANALSVRGVWAVVTQVRRGLRPPPQHPTGREKWTRTQSPIRDSGELMPAGTWPTPPESVGESKGVTRNGRGNGRGNECAPMGPGSAFEIIASGFK